jgi:hypothetical protein
MATALEQVDLTAADAEDSPSPRKRTLREALLLLRDLFPLTWSGLVLGGLGGLVYFLYAESEGDFILLGFGLAAMALVLTSLLFVLIVAPLYAWRMGLRHSGLPESLTVGVEHETTFRAPRLRFIPFVEVFHDWLVPSAMQVRLTADRGTWLEHITPMERGRFTAITRRFTVQDIFGFARVRFPRTRKTTLRIQPVPGRADMTLAIRRATDDGYSHPSGQPLGELVEMRRYSAGDPVRHILWKVYARSRRLMVRQPERAIAPKPAMVGFFVAGKGDEPSASTARLFLEQGLLGADFVFSADGARRPTSDIGEAVEQVIESRDFRDSGAEGLHALIRSVDRGRLDNLVVFAPAADGPWVDKVLAASKKLPMPPTVLITVDGAVDLVKRKRGSRLLFRREAHLAGVSDIPDIHDRLRAAGIDVKVLHRSTGHPVEAHGIEAWRSVQ